jgi:molybdopterin/thiamine biosynthesis adenylyltransferase
MREAPQDAMMYTHSTTRARFKDAPWFQKAYDTQIVIGGAGGIGSWLTLLLSRAGLSCYVYDMDTVEVHNIGGQLYCRDDLGKRKTSALLEHVSMLAEKVIHTYTVRFDEVHGIYSPVMASCFDNMEARRDMFNVWKKEGDRGLFIDGRLGAEHMEIYLVTPGREELYEATLFDSSDVPDDPCTMKQTSHAAAMIASHMTAFITNWLTNEEEPDSRELPFSWKYHIPLDLLTSEIPSYGDNKL